MAAVSLRGTLLARGELKTFRPHRISEHELEHSQGGRGLSSGDPPGEGGVGKRSDPTGSQRRAGAFSGWLRSLFGGPSWRGGSWSWLAPLLVPVIAVLMLLVIAPCITNCLTPLACAQVSKLQHAEPVQQGYIKLQLTTENISHPQMDTAIRTLRPETSKRGSPNAPHHPSSAGSSQRDLDAPVPQEWGFPSLEGGMLHS